MKLKNGKEVIEVRYKFFETYEEAKSDKNYFYNNVEVEGIYYPPVVEVNGAEYHPQHFERNIPVKPYTTIEMVYVRGAI